MCMRQMVEKATLVFMTRRDDRTYFWFGTPSVVHDFLAIISMSMWPWTVQGLVMRIYWSDHVNLDRRKVLEFFHRRTHSRSG